MANTLVSNVGDIGKCINRLNVETPEGFDIIIDQSSDGCLSCKPCRDNQTVVLDIEGYKSCVKKLV